MAWTYFKRFAPFLIGTIFFGWFTLSMRAEAIANESWPTTTGRVTASQPKEIKGSDNDGWDVDLGYDYTVDGKPYSGRGLSAGFVPHRDETAARAKAAEYSVGSQVVVYYDPAKPSDSIIEREPVKHGWQVLAGATGFVALLGVLNTFRRRDDDEDED